MTELPTCPRCGYEFSELVDRGGFERMIATGLLFGPYDERFKVYAWFAIHEDSSECPITNDEADKLIELITRGMNIR